MQDTQVATGAELPNSSSDSCDIDSGSPLDVAGATSAGTRDALGENQDTYLVASLNPALNVRDGSTNINLESHVAGPVSGTLMIVADGMGGLAHGELASRLAVEGAACFALEHVVHAKPKWSDNPRSGRLTVPGVREQLRGAIDASDESVRAHAGDDPIGSTITIAYVVWPVMYLAHVGDTRAYVVRDGRLIQLTKDHTVAEQLRNNPGFDTQLAQHWDHVLWNCLGDSDSLAQAEVSKHQLEPHDRWLLCSDGLHGVLSDEQVVNIMLEQSDSRSSARTLVTSALQEAGGDDVTAICGRYRHG